VAQRYVESGSQIVLTNTFGASRKLLQRHHLGDHTVEINRLGGMLSKEAAGDRCRVFGSIGPSGVLLMMGETTEEELADVFSEQAEALAEGGVDGLVIETMSDLQEARIATRAAVATGLPVVSCMCYDKGDNLDRTMMGVTPEQAAEALQEEGAQAIGANCGQGLDGYIKICARLQKATDLPLWIKANAGLPVYEDGQSVYRTTPEEFAGKIPSLIEAGATFVGGCCGTSPAFIRLVAERVRDFNSR
jgi:methionine synthase I (cobalamin-dependent)